MHEMIRYEINGLKLEICASRNFYAWLWLLALSSYNNNNNTVSPENCAKHFEKKH